MFGMLVSFGSVSTGLSAVEREGSQIVKQLPLPGAPALSTSRMPLWPAIISCAMESPKPVPGAPDFCPAVPR